MIIMNKTLTSLTKQISLNKIHKRSMFKTVIHKSAYYSRLPLTNTRPHTTTIVRMKKKSNAVQDLAADDTGIHSHALGQVCVKNDCETKACPQLCDNVKKVYTKGFFTHKPIAGKFCRFVSDFDANNKQDTQYYVKNADKSKEVDGQKASAYYQNKELKPDSKMNNYIQDSNIASKLNE